MYVILPYFLYRVPQDIHREMLAFDFKHTSFCRSISENISNSDFFIHWFLCQYACKLKFLITAVAVPNKIFPCRSHQCFLWSLEVLVCFCNRVNLVKCASHLWLREHQATCIHLKLPTVWNWRKCWCSTATWWLQSYCTTDVGSRTQQQVIISNTADAHFIGLGGSGSSTITTVLCLKKTAYYFH